MTADRNRADELLALWSAATTRPAPGFVAPATRRRSEGTRQWAFLAAGAVAVALAFVGLLALAGGSSIPPSPPPSPSASPGDSSPARSAAAAIFPTTVDGLAVQSVSELLTARASGEAKSGPYALRGYWTDRTTDHSCVLPPGIAHWGELEYSCSDGEWGITERDEEIRHIDLATGFFTPAAGPHLTPGFPYAAHTNGGFMQPLFSLPRVYDQFWPPVPIVVVGHFDDPLAADCQPQARQLCLDRFVIERIATFDPNSVPRPTPFGGGVK